MSTTVVITKTEDGAPLIRLDRKRHTARLHMEDVDELVGLRDAISQHLGDQHAPAARRACPMPAPQPTRLHELRQFWSWLTAPIF